jgi:hypothetical protein
MVLQIGRDLEPRARARSAERPFTTVGRAVTKEPNVFLTPLPGDLQPPWVPALHETGSRVRVVRRRTMLPWFAGAMSFALAFGVLNDPVVRADSASQIKSAAMATQSSAVRLYRFVLGIRI